MGIPTVIKTAYTKIFRQLIQIFLFFQGVEVGTYSQIEVNCTPSKFKMSRFRGSALNLIIISIQPLYFKPLIIILMVLFSTNNTISI